MPLFMDIHRNVKASPEDVANAHRQDQKVQDKYGAEFNHYWYDAENGNVFCLAKAPNKEAHLAVHREAHGLMPDEVHEVQAG